MTLGQKRRRFARLLPRLIQHAHALGFDVQIDEVKRGAVQAEWNAAHCGTCQGTKREHVLADHPFHPIGIADSLHLDGLAVDLVLFRNGRPLWATEHYRELGEYWESLDADLASWGGRFGDGGHFSLMHRGKR